jgi:hypothetical protein
VAEIFDLEIVDASNTTRWPEGMLGSAINNAGRALEGLLARWYEDTDGSLTSGGSANAYTLTSKRTIAALTNNTVMVFTANFANTGAATLAFNGLTAKAIRRPNGDALAAGDIVSGQVVVIIYKSSPDYWQLLSPFKGQASDTAVGGLEIAVQSEMEAASDTERAVVPGRMHFHPAMPKAWGSYDGSLVASHNISGVVDNGSGDYDWSFTTALSSANYAVVVTTKEISDAFIPHVRDKTTTGFTVRVMNENASGQASAHDVVVFGDMS